MKKYTPLHKNFFNIFIILNSITHCVFGFGPDIGDQHKLDHTSGVGQILLSRKTASYFNNAVDMAEPSIDRTFSR